jgi:hypothetical protein
VVVTLRNALASELRVWGLCPRPGPCELVTLAAGATREIQFTLNVPGTYHYWGSTSGQTLLLRERRDTQLGGAIVVDPREGAARDRVFVISILDDPLPGPASPATPERAVFTINGTSWPLTERLRYEVHDTVRWRVVNLSNDQHAMHLHGFHFTVESAGDGLVDRPIAAAQRRSVVTEHIVPGRVFAMSWTPTTRPATGCSTATWSCTWFRMTLRRTQAMGPPTTRPAWPGWFLALKVRGPSVAVVARATSRRPSRPDSRSS